MFISTGEKKPWSWDPEEHPKNKLGGEREEGGDLARKAEKGVPPGQEGSRWSSAPCVSAAVPHAGSSVLGWQGQLLCLSLGIQGFLSPDALQGMVQSQPRWAAVSFSVLWVSRLASGPGS